MRIAAGPVRMLVLSSSLALFGCGGSSGKGNPDGAADAEGGAAGAGGHAANGGGTAGAAGAGGGGAAGAGGGAAGSDAGPDGGTEDLKEGGPSVADAADAPEASSADAADGGLATTGGSCTAFAITAPAVTVTNLDNGKSIDEEGFTGGAIAPGTYWLTSVTHFGGAYAGPAREIWVIDTAAKTLEDASLSGTTPTYVGYTLTNASVAVLSGVPSCGATATSNWSYIASGGTLSVNPRGSNDVKIFTKQ